ncbi:MAG: RecQ family ATP-dependent DNA helicase [bacterium]|nr:RecQ family ATP-dependent DNA helicase [bacterium]
MSDQVTTLLQKGITATCLNSTIIANEQLKIERAIRANTFKFIYVSPERLQQQRFIQMCATLTISLVAIDEANCISQWGHDFRPAYLYISQWCSVLPRRPPILAVTATATERVVGEICTSLHLIAPQVFHSTFHRTNLSFSVQKILTTAQHLFYTLWWLKHYQGKSGIIYVLTRAAAEQLTSIINYYSILATPVAAYHGGLPATERSRVQELFIADALPVIVATSAFGMGIDKPNVRFVLHYHPSTSIEAYYQEAGRAGRDALPAECQLLYYPGSLSIAEHFIRDKKGTEKNIRAEQKLTAMKKYAEKRVCRHQLLLSYFSEGFPAPCQSCDVCVPVMQDRQSTEATQYSVIQHWLRKNAHTYHRLPSCILSNNQAHWLTLLNPQSLSELEKTPGVGTGWIREWGESYLAGVTAMC